jgi:hypothetical protein
MQYNLTFCSFKGHCASLAKTSFSIILKFCPAFCSNLHDKELHNLYPSPDIIRVKKSRRMGEMKNVFKVLVGKYRGRETTRKIWHRSEGSD